MSVSVADEDKALSAASPAVDVASRLCPFAESLDRARSSEEVESQLLALGRLLAPVNVVVREWPAALPLMESLGRRIRPGEPLRGSAAQVLASLVGSVSVEGVWPVQLCLAVHRGFISCIMMLEREPSVSDAEPTGERIDAVFATVALARHLARYTYEESEGDELVPGKRTKKPMLGEFSGAAVSACMEMLDYAADQLLSVGASTQADEAAEASDVGLDVKAVQDAQVLFDSVSMVQHLHRFPFWSTLEPKLPNFFPSLIKAVVACKVQAAAFPSVESESIAVEIACGVLDILYSPLDAAVCRSKEKHVDMALLKRQMSGGAMGFVLSFFCDHSPAVYDNRLAFAINWMHTALFVVPDENKAEQAEAFIAGGVACALVAALDEQPASPPFHYAKGPSLFEILTRIRALVSVSAFFSTRVASDDTLALVASAAGLYERLLVFSPEPPCQDFDDLANVRTSLLNLILPSISLTDARVAGRVFAATFALLRPMPSPRIFVNEWDLSALSKVIHLMEATCERAAADVLPRALLLGRQIISELPDLVGASMEKMMLVRADKCIRYAICAGLALPNSRAVGASLASFSCGSLDILNNVKLPQNGPLAFDYAELQSNARFASVEVAGKAGVDLPASLRKGALDATFAYLQACAQAANLLDNLLLEKIKICAGALESLLRSVPASSEIDPAAASSAIAAILKPFSEPSTKRYVYVPEFICAITGGVECLVRTLDAFAAGRIDSSMLAPRGAVTFALEQMHALSTERNKSGKDAPQLADSVAGQCACLRLLTTLARVSGENAVRAVEELRAFGVLEEVIKISASWPAIEKEAIAGAVLGLTAALVGLGATNPAPQAVLRRACKDDIKNGYLSHLLKYPIASDISDFLENESAKQDAVRAATTAAARAKADADAADKRKKADEAMAALLAEEESSASKKKPAPPAAAKKGAKKKGRGGGGGGGAAQAEAAAAAAEEEESEASPPSPPPPPLAATEEAPRASAEPPSPPPASPAHSQPQTRPVVEAEWEEAAPRAKKGGRAVAEAAPPPPPAPPSVAAAAAGTRKKEARSQREGGAGGAPTSPGRPEHPSRSAGSWRPQAPPVAAEWQAGLSALSLGAATAPAPAPHSAPLQQPWGPPPPPLPPPVWGAPPPPPAEGPGVTGAGWPPPQLLPPAPPASAWGGGVGASASWLPPPVVPAASLPAAAAALPAAGSGLANSVGEYNCFLNSVVQSLYHINCFRGAILSRTISASLTGEADKLRASKALLRALQSLCTALRRGLALRRDEGAAAVAPTELRYALASLQGAGGEAGRLNEMADAAEVLGSLYEAFQVVNLAHFPEMRADDTRIGRMFGMRVSEALICPDCGTKSHELTYSSFFHLVAAPALRAAAPDAQPGLSAFESRLARLLGADCKGCDKDVGGCGRPHPPELTLLQLPHVFTLSLTWDTAQAAEVEVLETLSNVEPLLRPARIFRGSDERRAQWLGDDTYWEAPPVKAEDAVYDLRAMVCYYGAHYACFCRTEEGRGPWTRFDDATVALVGDWPALVSACARGHLQPTVLFYEAAGEALR